MRIIYKVPVIDLPSSSTTVSVFRIGR